MVISSDRRRWRKQLLEAFGKWKCEQGIPDYVVNTDEKKRIEKTIGIKFVPSAVFTGSKNEYGFFGFELQDAPSSVGLKLAHNLKKPVAKICVETNQIDEVYESLNEAAIRNHLRPSALSKDVKYNKVIHGFIYKYLDRKSAPIQKRPSTHRDEHVPLAPFKDKRFQQVVKMDMNGNILNTFASQAEAAKEVGASKAALSDAVNFGKIVKGFKYARAESCMP